MLGFDWLVASVVVACAKCSEWAMAVLAGSGDKDGRPGREGEGKGPGCDDEELGKAEGPSSPSTPIWPM